VTKSPAPSEDASAGRVVLTPAIEKPDQAVLRHAGQPSSRCRASPSKPTFTSIADDNGDGIV